MTRMEVDQDAATIGDLLRQAAEKLERAGIPSPRGEARVLLQYATGLSAASVLAHPEASVPSTRQRNFLSAIERRARFEPVAYITGQREFFGLTLEVAPSVLVPRPETEMLVERALEAVRRLAARKRRDLMVVDLGTGSGAIAIALAVGVPDLRVMAIDISAEALDLARRNAARHSVAERIELRQGDLLGEVSDEIDLLVANLPYIPSGVLKEGLMPDVRLYEPLVALNGGPDGTVPTRLAMEQAVTRMAVPSTLLFEIGEGQGNSLRADVDRLYSGARAAVQRDYAGFERILSIEIGME